MNRDETQGGALIKYNSATVPHPSSRGMDWRRVGAGLPELMLNRRDLAHHTLLADDEEEEEEDGEGGLTRRFVLSRGLASLDELMVCKETDNIKQEFKLSDAVLQIKQEGEELADFQKKKNRKHPPAKILTINEDGSLGLQSAKPHVCEHCSSAFRTNYHLQRHAFIHTGEKPFQCSQCDMRFIQKYLLHRHEKIHTGEKPFRCDECGMKFIQKYHMERHKRTHSGEKPYQCTYCHQNFSRSDRVLKHQRMCHENRKTNEANAMDGPVVSEQDLGYSFPPKDCCQPKKKRQKVNERTRHPVNFPHKMEGGMGREDLGPGRSEYLSLYSHVSRVKNEHVVTEYSVELPDLAVGGSRLAEAPPPEVIHSHKLALKKLASKKFQRQPAGQQDDLSPLSSFDDGKVARYTFQLVDKPGLPGTESHTDLNTADPRQGAASKPPASSTNYDDAMQFVKKRRYLQAGAPSSGRDYALNTGIAARTSVNQASGASSSNDAVPAFISHSHTMKTEAKSTQDKNILSNEVLQTLLDHYSNKASGQPEISFGVAGTEVTSSISIDSSDMSPGSHVEALGMNALAPPNGHSSVLQEYSRFLHQALERTSQNDSYLSTQSLNFTPKSRSLSNQPSFTAIDTHYTSSSRMRSGMNSPPRLSSAKDAHFGLLVGDSQHSFSFSGEETNPSSVSSTEDFLDQVAPPKKSDSQVLNPPFQMAAFEQNFQSQFQSSGSAVPSHFSFSTGAVNLHGHEGGTHFSEYPAANVTHTRTQPTALFDSRNL